MTTINTGGPAFPFIKWRSPDGMMGIEQDEGMSLRDYFAGQALQGLISHLVGPQNSGPEAFAKRAYEYADAMVKQRECE